MLWYYQHLMEKYPTLKEYIIFRNNQYDWLINTIWYFKRTNDKQYATDYYYIKRYIDEYSMGEPQVSLPKNTL